MKGITQHKVICTNCGKSDDIGLDSSNTVYWGKNTFIISARQRTDGQWGFQCLCGQNNLVSEQEETSISDMSNPSVQELEIIMNNLVVKRDNKFIMEKV